jgi:hypothetical protein
MGASLMGGEPLGCFGDEPAPITRQLLFRVLGSPGLTPTRSSLIVQSSQGAFYPLQILLSTLNRGAKLISLLGKRLCDPVNRHRRLPLLLTFQSLGPRDPKPYGTLSMPGRGADRRSTARLVLGLDKHTMPNVYVSCTVTGSGSMLRLAQHRQQVPDHVGDTLDLGAD